MKIGIVTPTFRKLDGSTYNHLKSTLESVKNQTHQDYKIYLIGDDYSNNDELLELSKIIEPDKIYVENLPVAVERIKYNGGQLWVTGGANASNIGIQRALDDGYDYISLLDHDDMFLENHLKVISDCIDQTKTNFVTTRCGSLPSDTSTGYYTPYRPKSALMYKVTACTNFRYLNFRFRNMIEECKWEYPGDADLWGRINAFLTEKNEYGVLINVETCKRTTEGLTKTNPSNVK